MSKKNLILVIAGGMGNQLFMYATALKLAEYNGAKLFLDVDSRFSSDSYQQIFQLDKFDISADIAPPHLQYNRRWSRFRRNAYLKVNRWLSFDKRWIVLEETDSTGMCSFDSRLLDLKLIHKNTFSLDCFQCEKYFIDIKARLLEEFKVRCPFNNQTEKIATKIKSLTNPIAVHARQLRGYANIEEIETSTQHKQKSFSYYDKAINLILSKVEEPHFFCFGDNPKWLEKYWSYNYPVTFVSHNNTRNEAVQDFFLMGLCRHFIIGNSTFSWWPAWLSQAESKIVIAPENKEPDLWSGNRDVIPSRWIII